MGEVVSFAEAYRNSLIARFPRGCLVRTADGARARVEELEIIEIDGDDVPCACLWFEFGKPIDRYPLSGLTRLPDSWIGKKQPFEGDRA
jgi:hypothetical protein